MAIECTQFEFTAPITTGTQTIVSGLSYTPKAYIIIGVLNTSNATFQEIHCICIGFSDGTTSRCIGALSEDNQGTSDAGRAYGASVVRIPFATTPDTALDAIADHDSFGAGSIVINWTNAPASAVKFYGMCWGGADLQAQVKSYTYDVTVTGNRDYTGVSFQPEVMFTITPEDNVAMPTQKAHAALGFGAAVTTAKQFLASWVSEDAQGTSDTWNYASNDKCVGSLSDASGSATSRAWGSLDSFLSNGVRINWVQAPHDATNHWFALFMSGGDWDIGTVAKRTTTGTTQVSPNVNTIKGIMLCSANSQVSASAQSHARASFGFASSTSLQGACWTGDGDAQNTSISSKRSDDAKILITATEAATATSSVLTGVADLSAMSTTFTLNYTTATAAVADIFWVACGEATQQNLSRPVEDTYNVTDAISRLKSATRGIGDTYNITDSITRLVNKPRAIGDTYSVSDAIARLVNNTRAIADTFNITDAVTRALSNTRLIIDTINISDAITRLATRTRNVADTINISDAIARLVNNTRTIGDTYNVTDSLTKLTNHPRNIGDTYSISDSITVNVQRTRAVNDSYNVSDSITRTQTLVRAIADSFNITDAITRAQTLTRLLIESYSISDAVARALTLLRSISDTYNVTDAINRLVSFQRLLADTYNITDNLTRSQILTRGIGDTYNITDSVARVKTAIRNIGDTYSISDLVDRTLELTRIIEDTININDSVSRIQSIFRDVADNYNITDSITRAQNLTRNIEDDIDINDSIDRVLELTRDIEDTFDITDNVNNAASITVDVADTINVNDSVTRSQILSRTINDSYNVTDLVTRLVRFTRLVEDTYNVNDALIRQILVTKSLSDTYDITDEVETQIDEPANVINVDLEDSYNISDNITREQILQRIITESYNITDSIQKEGGQEPIVVDEHLQIKGGTGVGLGTQESLDKQKRRIIKRVVMDLLPESFPDKIYIDNQKAWFLNDKLDTNQKVREIRFTNKVSVPLLNKNGAEVAPFAIKNGITTIKQVKEKEQIRIAIKQMETNDYALKQFIQNTIPRKIKFENLDGIRITNNIYSNIIDSTISIQNAVTIKHTPINTITNHLLVNMQESAKPIVIKSPILLNTNYNFNIKNKIEIQNNNNNKIIRENRVTSLVKDNKKYSIKEIKNILLNKSSVAYDKILSNILKKNYSNTDEKEKLHFYLSYYQTRFDIEKTKTNHDMDKLDKKYGDKLEMLYAQIAEEYRNDLPNLWKAKDKYGKEIYDDIRSITQKGYNIGIDYVSRATERDDIYVTQKDLDNVKEATEEAYNHYWDSIQKNIKTKQIRLAYEEVKRLQEQAQEEVELQQQNQNFPIILPKDTIVEKPKEFLIKQEEDGLKPRVEITPEEATALFLKSLTTKIVALATYDKLLQMQDIFNQQNIQLQFIFATERDAAVCPDCLRFDYRFTHTVYTQYNYQLLPKPPIHFNCRCRILLKIGNRVIVK